MPSLSRSDFLFASYSFLLNFGVCLVFPPLLTAPGRATPPGYTLLSSVQFLNVFAAAGIGYKLAINRNKRPAVVVTLFTLEVYVISWAL